MALRNEMKAQGNLLFKWRSYWPIIIILVGLGVYVHQLRLSLEGHIEWHDVDYICLIISLLGLITRVVTIGFSADATSGRNTTEGQIADSINKTGPYSLCRHPLYVGNFFMWLGIAGFTQNCWFIIAFVFMYWVYYERIMYAEEEYLISKFGEAYTDWSRVVPAFVPRLGPWVKPQNSFSFTKVIRQEKAGILNLFLVIYIFKLIESYIIKGNYEVDSAWIIGIGLSLLWYMLIKVLQKTTMLFDKDRRSVK